MSLRRRAPGGGASPLSSHGSFAGLSLDLNSVLVRRSACERVTPPTFATCAGVGHGWVVVWRLATRTPHTVVAVRRVAVVVDWCLAPGAVALGVCLCTRGVRVVLCRHAAPPVPSDASARRWCTHWAACVVACALMPLWFGALPTLFARRIKRRC